VALPSGKTNAAVIETSYSDRPIPGSGNLHVDVVVNPEPFRRRIGNEHSKPKRAEPIRICSEKLDQPSCIVV